MKRMSMNPMPALAIVASLLLLVACGGGDTAEVTADANAVHDADLRAIVEMCTAEGTAPEVCTCTAEALRGTLDRDAFAALAGFASAISEAGSDDAKAAVFMGVIGNAELHAAIDEAERAERTCMQVAALEGMRLEVAAAEAARETRRQQAAHRQCPHTPAMPPRAPGAPVDDVAELRPGMSLADIEAVLECRGDIHHFDVASEWARKSQGLETRQLLRAADGVLCPAEARVSGGAGCEDGGYGFELLRDVTQEFIVALAGMPGTEQAGIIWRRTVFPGDRHPTVSSLVEALEGKYGPSHLRATEEGYYSLGHRRGSQTQSWVYLPNGSPIASGDSAARSRCVNGPRPTFQRQMSWNSGCGLTVRAEIVPVAENTLLARELNVVVMDQKRFNDAVGKFDADIRIAVEAQHRDRGVKPDL